MPIYDHWTIADVPGDDNMLPIAHPALRSILIRRGIRVSYLLDDVPYNHAMELHPEAHRAFVGNPKSAGVFWLRFGSLGRDTRAVAPF